MPVAGSHRNAWEELGRGVAVSRHLAAGVDAGGVAVGPAEGAEILHAGHRVPQERMEESRPRCCCLPPLGRWR